MQAQNALTSRKLRATSAKARRTGDLLVESAEQFAIRDRPTKEEINTFKELFFTLIFKADSDTKRRVSTALARSPYTPRTIAIYFSMEAIEIAAPMLLFSPVLSEWHLNTILNKCPISHYRVIARRTDLQPSTVKNLLLGDDPRETTFSILQKNPDIATNDEIRDLLGMPVDLVRRGIRNLTEPEPGPEPEPAEEIEQAQEEEPAALASVEVEEEVEDTPIVTGTAETELLELANKGGRISRSTSRIREMMATSPEQLERQLLDCARNANPEGFAVLIFQACELPTETTAKILDDQDAGKLAGIFKSLNVSRTAASQLLLLLNRNMGRDVEVFREVTKKYEELNVFRCRMALIELGASFAEFEMPRIDPRAEEQPDTGLMSSLQDRRKHLLGESGSEEQPWRAAG